jgi:heme/copper-type cytochrome/quinol oxidase subunit 3
MTARPLLPPRGPSRRLPGKAALKLLPPPPSSSKDIAWWAMALFCATEASFFAYLIMSYFYLGLRSPDWPPPGIEKPELKLPLIMTATLILSSVAVWWGEHGIKRGRRGQLVAGLAIGIALGLTFLGIQYREYHEKLRHFLPQTHSYTSIFYTTTGFHGAHVAFGLLMLGFVFVRALLGHFDGEEHTAVGTTSLYWHFVDCVWIAIVLSIYVSPHFY